MAMRCSDDYDESHWQTQMLGRIDDDNVSKFRPLVVIDPEDAEAVERFLDIWFSTTRDTSDNRLLRAMQAALREFAQLTPPKPDEPQGLGAVVRDAKGYLYSRGYPEQADDFVHVWHVVDRAANLPRSWWKWVEIDAVEVLSEGVIA
jgi:hypothetical protein